MRKQSQLADLIAGSGLVSGAARRASQDGLSVPAQPVLYHFGARSGSTSARDQRDRPPLPNVLSSSNNANPPAPSSGGIKTAPGVAWSSNHGPIASTQSTDASFLGGNSSIVNNGAVQTYRSVEVPVDSVSTGAISASIPLPHLSILRSNSLGGADAHDGTPPVPPYLGSGFLPAVGGCSDMGQPPLDAQQPQPLSSLPAQLPGSTLEPGPGIAVGGAAGVGQGQGLPVADPRSGSSGCGAGGAQTSLQTQAQPGWTWYGNPGVCVSVLGGAAAEAGSECKPQVASNGGNGAAEVVGAAGAWQPHVLAGGTEGSSAGGYSGGRNLPSSGGGRNAHSGGRTRAFGGGGGGFNSKQRWVRPSSTTRTSGIHRSSSDSSVRTASDAAGIALAMSVQGAWSAGADSSSGGGAASGSSPRSGGAGDNSGGANGSGSAAAGVRSRRVETLTPGAASAELVVVEEEDSSASEPSGSGGVAVVATAATGNAAATQASASAAVAGPRSHASFAPQVGSGAAAAGYGLPSPYAGPAGAASAAAARGSSLGGTSGATGSVLTTGHVSAPAGIPSSGTQPPLASIGPTNEVMELRRIAMELNGQVARLTAQLRDSELSAAQLQSMAAAAVASEREAAEMDAVRRHMKALKAAEAARDKAEAGRRGAEKRAKAAEEELAATKEKLEVKTKQVAELEAAVAAAQSSLDKQRTAHEEARETLEAQHKAQTRKLYQDMHIERNAQQECASKMQADIAKRNQTILALQADLEAAQASGANKDKQLEELQEAVAKLQANLDHERERGRWMAAAQAEAEAERQKEAGAEEAQVPSPSRSKAPADSADGAPATLTSTGAGAPTPGTPASAAASAAAVPVLRRGVSASSSHFSAGGSGLPVMDEHSRAIRKMQTEVAAIREDYARRLVEMDDVVASCESNMRDGIQGLERMFNVLVSRTAGILAGRLGYFKGIMPGAKVSARPGTPVVAAGGGGRPSTAAAAAAAAASTAVLHMNERLAAENAQLLAELSRWQSGRHAMLRKLNMVVLGTDPLPPAAPPLTHQQKIAQALAAVTGQQPSPPSPPQATAPLTPSAPRIFQYQQNFTGTPPPANTAATAAADTAMTAAREALAAATRDALLAGRKELLPAVMTAEGWGGAAVQGGWDTTATTQQLHGGKVESSVAAAESSLRLRTQLLALQAEVTRSRATGGEVVEKGREREVLEEDHAIALADVRRELAAAKQQISHMQRELERARAGINTDGGRPHAQDTVERERLEDALAAARDDAVRHKQVASAAKRDLEAKERAMEEAQLRYERLEAQCRDARSEAQRQGEGVKRLRLLLAQAKSLLKEQGVSFMEDDPGLDLLLTAGPQGQGGGGGGAKTGKAQRPAGSGTDADGPLFKALDAREREKEMQRLQSEVADLSAQLTAANKELKRTRKAAAAAAEAGAAAEREQRLQLASTIEALANEAEAAKDAARASQKQLQDSKHEGGDLRRQIAELNDKLTRAKLDGEYLRARAAAGKMKPKLTHARALSLSISPAAAAPSSEG